MNLKRFKTGLFSLLSTVFLANPSFAISFIDEHNDGSLAGWSVEGNRQWQETNSSASPVYGSNDQGFLINSNSCSSDGTLEISIKGDQWNGCKGGIVFRWSSPSSFYFASVVPGNQYSNRLALVKNSFDIYSNSAITVAQNFAMGTDYTLKIEMKGSTFKFYIDNILRGTVTDESFPSGKIGYGYAAEWNDYIDFDRIQWTEESGDLPAAPANLAAMSVSPLQIYLSWTDNATNETNYKIESRIGNGTFNEIAVVPANSTTFQCTGLIPNTSYSFRIRAYNDNGYSEYSSISSAQTPLITITDLQASQRAATSIKLKWTPVSSTPVARYMVFCDGVRLGTTISKVGNYSNFDLIPLHNYIYQVQALNSDGLIIGASNQISVSTTNTNIFKTKFTMLVLDFDPRMSTSVPTKFVNDPTAVNYYNEHFAGKLNSEINETDVHSRVQSLEPAGCKGELWNCFLWNRQSRDNAKNNNYIKYFKNFFRSASIGSCDFSIYSDSAIKINSYSPANDLRFQQSDEVLFEMAYSPVSCSEKGCTNPDHYPGLSYRIEYDVNSHGGTNYQKLLSTPMSELRDSSIIDLIEAGSIDGVWVVNGPVLRGFAENACITDHDFGYGQAYPHPECSRDFFVNGFSLELRAFDAYSHMFEGMLNVRSNRNRDNWPRIFSYNTYDNPVDSTITRQIDFSLVGRYFMTNGRNTDWTTTENCRASERNGNCGDSHYPPTSLFSQGNYQYDNPVTLSTYTPICADDWFLYPNLPSPPQKRMTNKIDFGAYYDYYVGLDTASSTPYPIHYMSAMYHQWWMNHIPHNPGVTDGKLNNWWPYVFDINNFKGEVINYEVTGFPQIRTQYPNVNDETGTDCSEDLWTWWHSDNANGKNAIVSVVNSKISPDLVANGNYAVKVAVNQIGSSNHGRNDVYYPIAKNAKWNFSSARTITLSLKFINGAQTIANGGTNPVIRLYKNSGTRLEFVPIKDGKFDTKLGQVIDNTWYNFTIPITGNDDWKRVVVGYVDPSLNGQDKANALQAIAASVLSEVNYIEVSVSANTLDSQPQIEYVIDNLIIR